MPDLRERFDYDAVLDNVTQPAYDDLRHEGRRRRTRRNVVTAGGLAVLAVAAAVTVPMLLRPTPRSVPAAQPVPLEQPRSGDHYFPRGMDFFDARHGYVMYHGSPSYGSEADNDECRMAMRVTADGGESWSDLRAVPCVVAKSGGMIGGPQMTGPESFVNVSGNGNVFHRTRDGGRTWERYRPRTRTAESFPEGVVPRRVCAGAQDCADDNRLEWYDPRSGDRMRLAEGPDMGTLRTEVRAADGSVWVSGYTDDGRYAVAVTRDNGRTWNTVPMDLKGDILEGPNVATYDGQVGYLVVESKAKDSDGNAYDRSIMRTDDGGETWSRVPTEKLSVDHFGVFDVVVSPTGALLIPGIRDAEDNVRTEELRKRDDESDARVRIFSNPTTWYVSRDGGVSFSPAKGMPELGGISQVSGRYFGSTANGELAYYVSDDTEHWRKLDVPYEEPQRRQPKDGRPAKQPR